jgi:meiotic recombination protein DMC1
LYQSVDELQSQGINVQDITKLKASGICTILSVSQTTRKNLLKIKGLSEAKVEKLKEAATKMLPPTFATATEIGIRREACVMITTGSRNVDAMLGGMYIVQLDSFTKVNLSDFLLRWDSNWQLERGVWGVSYV